MVEGGGVGVGEIEFFFDVASSYSYLAAVAAPGVAEAAGLPVRWRPMLLGAVFKATGNASPALVPAKARWMMGDLAREAARAGVPFVFPARHFPPNSLLPMRALCAVAEGEVPRAARALFDAFWVRGGDVGAAAVVVEALDGAGFDGAAVVARASAQEVKDRLRANTDEAVARGAFGAPSFFLGDALYWGHDRMGALAEDARGARR